MYVCIYVCMCVCMYMCVCVCVCARACAFCDPLPSAGVTENNQGVLAKQCCTLLVGKMGLCERVFMDLPPIT
jgi:hypothetical protein